MTDSVLSERERPLFEAWFRTTELASFCTLDRWPNDKNHDGGYRDHEARLAWQGWLAKARAIEAARGEK